MVRKERLELSHPKIPEPKSGASTNSATLARYLLELADILVINDLLMHHRISAPIFWRLLAKTYKQSLDQYGVDDGDRTHDNKNHNLALYQLSYAHHKKCAPGRIRTCYPRLRRPMLYPNELRAQ
jgi:hypothetical protein